MVPASVLIYNHFFPILWTWDHHLFDVKIFMISTIFLSIPEFFRGIDRLCHALHVSVKSLKKPSSCLDHWGHFSFKFVLFLSAMSCNITGNCIFSLNIFLMCIVLYLSLFEDHLLLSFFRHLTFLPFQLNKLFPKSASSSTVFGQNHLQRLHSHSSITKTQKTPQQLSRLLLSLLPQHGLGFWKHTMFNSLCNV